MQSPESRLRHDRQPQWKSEEGRSIARGQLWPQNAGGSTAAPKWQVERGTRSEPGSAPSSGSISYQECHQPHCWLWADTGEHLSWIKLWGGPGVATGWAWPGWGSWWSPVRAPPTWARDRQWGLPFLLHLEAQVQNPGGSHGNTDASSCEKLRKSIRGQLTSREQKYNNLDSILPLPLLPGAPGGQSAFPGRSPVSHPGVHSPPHPLSFLS